MESPSDGGPPPSETLPLQSEGNPNGVADTEPWVRYRVEYRDAITDEILSEKASRNKDDVLESDANNDEPVFELVTRYKTRESVVSTDDTAVPPVLGLGYTKHLNLFSPAIINALQSVVEYYPSQDLTGNPVVVKYPYAVLAHHYDELKAFGQACAAKTPEDRCVREEHANAHLELLLKYLDDTIMEGVRLEQERNKRDYCTWEFYWVAYKPGATFVQMFLGHDHYNAHVIKSVEGGIFDDPPRSWKIEYWNLDFSAYRLGRVTDWGSRHRFDGEEDDGGSIIYPSPKALMDAIGNDTVPQAVKDKIEYGRIWWSLRNKQCRDYKGKSKRYPHNKVSSQKIAI